MQQPLCLLQRRQASQQEKHLLFVPHLTRVLLSLILHPSPPPGSPPNHSVTSITPPQRFIEGVLRGFIGCTPKELLAREHSNNIPMLCCSEDICVIDFSLFGHRFLSAAWRGVSYPGYPPAFTHLTLPRLTRPRPMPLRRSQEKSKAGGIALADLAGEENIIHFLGRDW